MPQFVLDHGSADGVTVFNALDAFTQGYVTAMFWTEEDELDGAAFEDLDPESLQTIITDCQLFQRFNHADLDAYEAAGRDLEHAGHDFWLTRNGHGTGFWDRGMGELGGRLADAAGLYGEVYVYKGTDGLVYHG
jgi:hypothetical protein